MAADDWQEIWVGHDQRRLQARRDDDRHLLRLAAWEREDWGDVITAPPGELERALRQATQHLVHLADRITDALPRGLDEGWRRAIARRLAGADRC